MQDAKTILLSLYQRGIAVACENGQLQIQGPRGSLRAGELNTLRALKREIISSLEEARTVRELPIKMRGVDWPVPLTPFQLRWWRTILGSGADGSVRTSSGAIRILGPLDVVSLQRSIESVIYRHESLRTTIKVVDGIPRQSIGAPREYCLDVIDLRSHSNVKECAEHRAHEFLSEPIDVSSGPLFDARLLRLSKHEHVLVLAQDHLIFDWFSYHILVNDLWASYDHFENGSEIALPDFFVQLGDYALWLQQTYGDWLKEHGAYWARRLADAPSSRIRADEQLIDWTEYSTVEFSFRDRSSAQLRELARRERTLLSLVVLSIFVAVLSRCCNRKVLFLWFVSHGRWCPELQNTIGCLVDILHLRVVVEDGDSFEDLLRQVTAEYYTAYDHHDFNRVPELFPEYTCDASVTHLPLDPSAGFLGSQRHAYQQARAIRSQPFPIDFTRLVKDKKNFRRPFLPLARLGVGLSSTETDAGIAVSLAGEPDVFSPREISRLSRNIQLFAEEVVQYPGARIGRVPIH